MPLRQARPVEARTPATAPTSPALGAATAARRRASPQGLSRPAARLGHQRGYAAAQAGGSQGSPGAQERSERPTTGPALVGHGLVADEAAGRAQLGQVVALARTAQP